MFLPHWDTENPGAEEATGATEDEIHSFVREMLQQIEKSIATKAATKKTTKISSPETPGRDPHDENPDTYMVISQRMQTQVYIVESDTGRDAVERIMRYEQGKGPKPKGVVSMADSTEELSRMVFPVPDSYRILGTKKGDLQTMKEMFQANSDKEEYSATTAIHDDDDDPGPTNQDIANAIKKAIKKAKERKEQEDL
jgi:hypothetical protein